VAASRPKNSAARDGNRITHTRYRPAHSKAKPAESALDRTALHEEYTNAAVTTAAGACHLLECLVSNLKHSSLKHSCAETGTRASGSRTPVAILWVHNFLVQNGLPDFHKELRTTTRLHWILEPMV